MRRHWFVVVLVLALIAAACGDDDGGGEQATDGDEQVTDNGDGAGDETTPTTIQNGRSTEISDRRSVTAGGEQRPRVVAQDNRFVAENIQVDVGSRVRWRNEGQNEHNIIIAREGVEPAGEEQPFEVLQDEFQPGDGYDFTFAEAGVFEYYCSLHGTPDQGMVGAVIVGDEEYVPEIPIVSAEKVEGTLRVPDEYDTIQAAVDSAAENALVLVDEGVYDEAVVVNSPNIVIRGMDRNETILDGGDTLANGFHVFANGVVIENMTARNYTTNGFFWDGVTGYRGSYLTTHNIKAYGIYAFGSVTGQFDHSYASGSDDGGFYIGQCDPCDAVITDVIAENNQLGYSGTNASDVTIVNSTFVRNRIGIVPNSWDVEDLAPVRNNVFAGNIVVDNNNLDAPSNNDLYDLLNNVGIEMGGTVDSIAVRNLVLDHDWIGIVVNAFPKTGELDGEFYNAMGNEIRDNVVTGSGRADLAAALVTSDDGNCWQGNVFEVSAPADIEALQPCDGASAFEGALDPGPLLGEILERNEPNGLDYTDMPPAPPQETMPGDPATEPAVPATTDTVPLAVDIDAIELPELPAEGA